MRIGQRVTVLNRPICPLSMPRFLRCYITKITPTLVLAYDPIREYSWGWTHNEIKRVMYV